MANHPYMPFYGDDWRSGTEDIAAEWRGPYLDLCWRIFDQGGRVPNIEAALARHARLGTAKFRRFWRECGHKFIVDGDLIGHRKIDGILSTFAEKSRKVRQSGAKGGRKTQQKQRTQSSDAKAYQAIGLVTTNVVNQAYEEFDLDGLKAALDRLRRSGGPSDQREIELLALQIHGFRDGVLIASPYAADRFSQSLRRPLASAGLRLCRPSEAGASNVVQLRKGESA